MARKPGPKNNESEKKPTPFFQEQWKTEWQNMPEFIQNDLEAFQTIIVRFRNQEDVDAFAKLAEQPITPSTKSIWYPRLVKGLHMNIEKLRCKG